MARAADILAGDVPDLPPPRVAVPRDLARRNEREIEQLLRPRRKRRMSILGLLLAVVLAGLAAFAAVTVIAPSSGSGIASVVGPGKGELAARYDRGKAAGYAAGIKAGRAVERRAGRVRERRQYVAGVRAGTKTGTQNGQRDGYSKGYQDAQGVYAGAVAQAQGQIDSLSRENQALKDALKRAQAALAARPTPGSSATTTGG